MAMPGRAPKLERSRERDNRDWLYLPADGYTGEYPRLPRSYHTDKGRVVYLAETRTWYETWATSPQATQFEATDWQRLYLLARLVDVYHRAPTPAALSQIRQVETQIGGTEEDRRKLGWRIAHDAPADANRAAENTPAGIPPDDEADTPTGRPSRRDPRLGVIDGGNR